MRDFTILSNTNELQYRMHNKPSKPKAILVLKPYKLHLAAKYVESFLHLAHQICKYSSMVKAMMDIISSHDTTMMRGKEERGKEERMPTDLVFQWIWFSLSQMGNLNIALCVSLGLFV